MQDAGYPTGAQCDGNAPWNQPRPIDVDVDIVMTISKRVQIRVDDYDITDGEIDLYNSNLYNHVKDQITLPTDLEGAEGWIIDDMYVDDAYVN